MKINGNTVNAKFFAFDNCHKIYICESDKDVDDALITGYEVYPIRQIKNAYENSCPLKFISNWALDKYYVSQCENAKFTEEL